MADSQSNRALLVRLIHLALFSGIVLAGVVMFIMRGRMPAPSTGDPTLGLALSGVSVLTVVIALTQLRARIVPRRSDQSSEDYWSDIVTNTNALILWGVLEGAGLLSIIGYFVSGSAIPLGVAVITVIIGFVMRPATLEG